MNTNNNLLIELQYIGSIEYYAQLLHYPNIIIEQHEHFERSTLRNRTYIATSNNVFALAVPLEHGRQQRCSVKNVRISYSYAWQRQQWHSLEAAYRSSPFFEYFEDYFKPFYEKNYTFLWDYNHDLLQTILRIMQLKLNINYTTEYHKDYALIDPQTVDYRSKCYAKIPYQNLNTAYMPPIYHQVFTDIYPFTPNLSIADLLFNTGTDAVGLLKKSMKG